MPKGVVSTTLTEAVWNNTVIIRGNVAEEVATLKDRLVRGYGATSDQNTSTSKSPVDGSGSP